MTVAAQKVRATSFVNPKARRAGKAPSPLRSAGALQDAIATMEAMGDFALADLPR